MLAGRRSYWAGLVLLAVGLASAGCQHAEPLRQGVRSTYHQELRQLAEEINRKELAKVTEATDQQATASETTEDLGGVAQTNHWHAPSLLSAVTLKAPVPLDYGESPP
jgi:hypothetical protein